MSKAIEEQMLNRAKALLADKTVTRVAGWKKGLFGYDVTPGIFTSEAQLDSEFVYNQYCGANLSKYMVKENANIETNKATVNTNNKMALQRDPNAVQAPLPQEKTLVFLKPCDTYSFNQLLKEHRIKRENVYVIGIPCVDFVQVPEGGTEKDAKALEKCVTCKSTKHVVYDELIGEDGEVKDSSRFDQVEELEKMNPEERYNFWRGELSRCIRCNACRNVCPACTCETCIFDNPNSGIAQKAAADTFEENMFHIIRAFHVAGRCTDCGECSRVCPQNIPLHLLNRKFIKDINELYGEFQAGEDTETRAPLNIFNTEDVEPSIVHQRANEKEGN